MGDAPHDVELRIGGTIYGGFIAGHVIQSLEQMASTFSLQYADRWRDGMDPIPIHEGERCSALIDGEAVLEGHVDDLDHGYTADTFDLRAAGRSLLGDLVDCAAVADSAKYQWRGKTLGALARDICEPFGVEVQIDGEEGPPFARFAVEDGETAAEALTRMGRLRSLLPTDQAGDLVFRTIEPPWTTVGVIRPGKNVIEGSRIGSWRDRFSDYVFRGQTQATDELSGMAASQLEHRIEDPRVNRYRPTVIVSGGQDGDRDLGRRAVIERNRAAGKAERLRYTVEGFRSNGAGQELWRPGQMVQVEDERLRVDGAFVVVDVENRFEVDEPMVTTLVLSRPEAFGTGDYPVQELGGQWR